MSNQNDDVPDRDDFVHMHIGKAASRVTRANFVDGFINDIADQQDGTPGALIDQDAVDLDDSILALGGLTGAANKLPYFASASEMALADFPVFARTLAAAASTAAFWDALGIDASRQIVGFFGTTASLEAATVPAATTFAQTSGYATAGTGGARYLRTSYATIAAAGYPATSYKRSVDRYMPDGSTDATNGGYWLNTELHIRPEMFGVATTATTTTAMMKDATDFAHLAARTLRLRGTYSANGPIGTNATRAAGGCIVEFDGDVTINYSGTATEYFLYLGSTAAAVYSLGMSGGTLTINANSLIQRALAIASASGSTTTAGECHLRNIRVNDVYAPSGSNGFAYGISVDGPMAHYTFENLAITGASRHTSLDASGDCKGLRVSQARVPVVVRNCRFKDIRNLVQDNDCVFVYGPLESSIPVAPLATFENCEFIGYNGRGIKTQVRHTVVNNCVFDHAGQTTISNGHDIDAQFGSYQVNGGSLLVDAAPGASYVPIVSQTLYATGPLRSVVRDFKGTTGYVLPNLAYAFMGANSPTHDVLIERCEVIGTAAFATTVFSRDVVEFSASEMKASANKLSITLQDNFFQSNTYLIGYTGGDGTDISAKLGIHAVRNKTSLAPGNTSRSFEAMSGTAVTKLTDYTFADNDGWYSYFATWDLNLNTIRPGNDLYVNLAGATVTGGPASPIALPASGVIRVLIGTGETTWWAYKSRDLILGNNERHWYTQTGTWVEKADRGMIEATATYDIASLALGASGAIQSVTVTGAALGDYARASLSIDTVGVVLHAWVSAANTVKYFAHNLGGADPTDLASATVKIRVEK